MVQPQRDGVVIPTDAGGTTVPEADTTTTSTGSLSTEDMLSFELISIDANMTTDEGPQVVQLDGLVELVAAPEEIPGIRSLRIKRFSAGTSSAPAKGNETGGVSFVVRPSSDGVDGTWNTTSNKLDLMLGFDVSYWLLTELLAPQEPQDRDEDSVPAPSESWTGSISGLVVPAGPNLMLSFDLEAAVDAALIGAIAALTAGAAVPVSVNGNKQPNCPKEKQCDLKIICIQPVFIGTGATDAKATGSSYGTMQKAADDIFKKCCIKFDWKAAKYVNKNEYKDTKGPVEEQKLLKEEDEKGTNDCIEVFFVDTMTDPNTNETHFGGDGVCYHSETKQAKVIVADTAVKGCTPPSVNVLAHELGHALGDLSHVGSTGTVMEPSGNQPNCPGVNPAKISEKQCKDLQHPDLKVKKPKEVCCKNWDIIILPTTTTTTSTSTPSGTAGTATTKASQTLSTSTYPSTTTGGSFVTSSTDPFSTTTGGATLEPSPESTISTSTTTTAATTTQTLAETTPKESDTTAMSMNVPMTTTSFFDYQLCGSILVLAQNQVFGRPSNDTGPNGDEEQPTEEALLTEYSQIECPFDISSARKLNSEGTYN